MNEIQALQKQIDDLKYSLDQIIKADRYQFLRAVEILEKVGFFKSTPTSQWSSGTGRGDSTGSGGTTVTTSLLLNGNTGTSYYGLGDVIAALKAYGLLKN